MRLLCCLPLRVVISSLPLPGTQVVTEDDVAWRRKLRSVHSADSLLGGGSSSRYSDASSTTFPNPYTGKYHLILTSDAVLYLHD